MMLRGSFLHFSIHISFISFISFIPFIYQIAYEVEQDS